VYHLQQAILDWIERQWSAETAPLGTPVSIKHSDYSARSGEVVPCNPPAAGMTVFLPKITTSVLGQSVTVVEVGGQPPAGDTDHVITVRPGDQATINGLTSVAAASGYAMGVFVAVTPTLWVKK
jgi:hypothetical protein